MLNHTTDDPQWQLGESRALDAWAYKEWTGFDTPADYIAAGCPMVNPDTGASIARRSGAEPRLGYSHISGETAAAPEIYSGVVEVYENDVVVKRPGPAAAARGDRGEVCGMSQASHNRMIQQLNWLHWPEGPVYFCTLTWPDNFPADHTKAHDLFKAFIKRLRYRFGQAEIFWRREWRARRSGENKGQVAPHYHFFCFLAGVDEIELSDMMRCAWSDMTYDGSSDYVAQLIHGSDVVKVTDRGHACRYISKYMAKVDAGDYFKTGRAWGYSKGLDFSPVVVFRFSAEWVLLLRWLLQALLKERGSKYAERFEQMPEAWGFHLYLPAGDMLDVLFRLRAKIMGIYPREKFESCAITG